MDAKLTGELIARKRKELGLSQAELAERVHVTDKAISRWENGTSEPSTTNLCALAKLYNVPPEELLRSVQI